MNFFVLNAGSSSLKFQVLQMPEEKMLLRGIVDGIGLEASFTEFDVNGERHRQDQRFANHEEAVSAVLARLKELQIPIEAAAHRVVHGGEKYRAATQINEQVIQDIQSLCDLAPLHNPVNLRGILACQKFMPEAPNFAVFDTAFHQTLPPKAYLYALPYELYQKYGIRKYGFHGISHQYVSREAMLILKENIKDFKILSCHLGSGASICAISGGKSVEISMGFTPLDGLMMGTRAGSFDPEVIPFLLRKGYTIDQVEEMIQKRGGLKGISKHSDVRALREEELAGEPMSELAFEMFVYRVHRFIGSYSAALGGLDVLIFTGGVGEKAYYVRRRICENFDYLGIKIDMRKNRANETIVSTGDSPVTVMVVPTNEELQMARESYRILLRGKEVKA